MKKVIALTAIAIGSLYLLIPRYILPVCEFSGFSRMHCSDTAIGENFVGIALLLIGTVTFFLRTETLLRASAFIASALFVVAIWMPEHFGYCLSQKMPCNFGTVPAIRFLSILGLLIMSGMIIASFRTGKRNAQS